MSNTLAKNLHYCLPLINCSQHKKITHKPHLNNNKTYNSLYEDKSCFPHTTTTLTPASPSSVSDTDTDMIEADEDPETPDLTAAYASRRFFISSPGRSNSIVDSLSSATSSPEPPPAVAGGVAVETFSPNPYLDFRRSMEEMVEARVVARGDDNIREVWQYLQELLLSYLSLNPKNTHKYIVRAFADMVVVSSLSHINNSATSSSSSPSFSSFCGDLCNDNNNVSYVEIFNNSPT